MLFFCDLCVYLRCFILFLLDFLLFWYKEKNILWWFVVKNLKIKNNLYNIGWGVFVVCSYGIEDDDDVGEVSFY